MAEIVSALDAVFQIELHVVAQVVETKLVVGAVGYVGGIGVAALLVIQVVDDDSYCQSQER